MSAKVFKIESFSTVDGKGIRSVVFLSGCNLKCGYCHNPECLNSEYGTSYTVSELVDKVLKFKNYWQNGGVTFSGGEPLLMSKYLLGVCTELKKHGINIAIETSGSVKNDDSLKLIEIVDNIMLDIKAYDNKSYYDLTKAITLDNVLDFIEKIKYFKKEITLRTVIVPGFNDNLEMINLLKKLRKEYAFNEIDLLPFSKLSLSKYEQIGQKFRFESYNVPSSDIMIELENKLKEN